MGTNSAPLVADLFLFCYERDFILPLSDACNTTSRYLDTIINIHNIYFDNMVGQIYPAELQLNTENTSDTEASFLPCICSFLIILFRPQFMINVTILIF